MVNSTVAYAQLSDLSGITITPQSLKKCEKEAKKGDFNMQYVLAIAYSLGQYGVPKDLKKGLEWGKKAFEN